MGCTLNLVVRGSGGGRGTPEGEPPHGGCTPRVARHGGRQSAACDGRRMIDKRSMTRPAAAGPRDRQRPTAGMGATRDTRRKSHMSC